MGRAVRSPLGDQEFRHLLPKEYLGCPRTAARQAGPRAGALDGWSPAREETRSGIGGPCSRYLERVGFADGGRDPRHTPRVATGV